MNKRVLVAGGSLEGIQAALDLADWGARVTLVEESPSLHGSSSGGPGQYGLNLHFMPKLLRAASHPNINIITDASVVQTKGERGDFKVTITEQPRYVNTNLCSSCGRCEQECPVNIISPLASAHDGRKAIHRPISGIKSVPSAYTVEKEGKPPCPCPVRCSPHSS